MSMDDHHHDVAPVDPRLAAAAAAGCEESRLTISRRAVLGITAGLFSSAFVPKWAEAATDDPRLLVVVLRGGMDGINTVVPHGDPAYVGMRGNIAIPRASTVALDSFFGLNPALAHFGTLYKAKQAAVVHATCVPLQNRSHFDAQDNLENGLPGLASNATGWMNRLITAVPAGAPIRSYGAIEIGEAPLLLRGPAPVLGWSPTGFSHPNATVTNAVASLYQARDSALYDRLMRGLRADELAERVADPNEGNISTFRKGFRGAGRLLAAADGPRMAVLSVDNFDTHSQQGVLTGYLSSALSELDLGLQEFQSTVGALWDKTIVLMVTEFGRTVRVNGDGGTDHGVGTVALLAGGAVNGGKVYGDWPGIGESQLFDGSDLRPTTDLRAVFKGVLSDHIGVPKSVLDTTIFPSSDGVVPFQGLVRSSTAGRSKSNSTSAVGYHTADERPLSAIARYRAMQGA